LLLLVTCIGLWVLWQQGGESRVAINRAQLPTQQQQATAAKPVEDRKAQQQAPPVRVRGTIEAVDGPMLTVKSRDGQTTYHVKVAYNVAIRGIVKASLADIKQNAFIGVTGMPQGDGSQKAVEIHIFPEAMRGTGEGHRPWDLAPNSTMTNATVAQMVKGVEGDEITLKYKDGEKKIVVVPSTAIVTYV